MNFPDPADEAADIEQHMIKIALANRQHSKMPYNGCCYNCDEAISKGSYCSAECREDHQKLLWADQQRPAK